MAEYAELIKALRCKRDDCEGCDLAFFDKDEGWMCQYAAKDDDAAATIEELSKTVKDLTTKVECSPMQISGKAFDSAIEAWNEKARRAVQDGQ